MPKDERSFSSRHISSWITHPTIFRIKWQIHFIENDHLKGADW